MLFLRELLRSAGVIVGQLFVPTKYVRKMFSPVGVLNVGVVLAGFASPSFYPGRPAWLPWGSVVDFCVA